MASRVTATVVEDGATRILARLGRPGGVSDFALHIDGASFAREKDFLVPMMLLPAMRAGTELTVSYPISPKLLTGAAKIQEIFALWEEDFVRVKVRAPAREPSQAGAGSAAFFSAGVDSFYTALKNAEQLTHLIFVHEVFDSRVAPDQAASTARAAAAALGKPLIEVRTDIKRFAAAAGVSHAYYHGSLLAAIALLLQGRFARVFVASSFNYGALPRWGSHPLIDPLWSTEALEIAHDGCEATRPMKVAALAASDVAMRYLRVCQNRPIAGAPREAGAPPGELNCGRCKKCLRTMVNLRAVGALERCEALPGTIDLDTVAALPISDERDFVFLKENLQMAEANDPDLARALATCLERNQLHDPFKAMFEKNKADERIRRQTHQIEALTQSWSWRLTRPFRAATRRIRSSL